MSLDGSPGFASYQHWDLGKSHLLTELQFLDL